MATIGPPPRPRARTSSLSDTQVIHCPCADIQMLTASILSGWTCFVVALSQAPVSPASQLLTSRDQPMGIVSAIAAGESLSPHHSLPLTSSYFALRVNSRCARSNPRPSQRPSAKEGGVKYQISSSRVLLYPGLSLAVIYVHDLVAAMQLVQLTVLCAQFNPTVRGGMVLHANAVLLLVLQFRAP